MLILLPVAIQVPSFLRLPLCWQWGEEVFRGGAGLDAHSGQGYVLTKLQAERKVSHSLLPLHPR